MGSTYAHCAVHPVRSGTGEAHNHNLPGPNTTEMIKTYLSQGIFYVMIQANIPDARMQLKGLLNTPGSIDTVFANGLFTGPGGHPFALVERKIRGGSMTVSDRDGGFLLPVSSIVDVDRQWLRVRSQRPDFIKMVLAYSEERGNGWSPPADSDRYGLRGAHRIERDDVGTEIRAKLPSRYWRNQLRIRSWSVVAFSVCHLPKGGCFRESLFELDTARVMF